MEQILKLPLENRAPAIRGNLEKRRTYFEQKIREAQSVWGEPLWDNILYRRSFYTQKLITELLTRGTVDTQLLANQIVSETGFINSADYQGVCMVMEKLLSDERELTEPRGG